MSSHLEQVEHVTTFNGNGQRVCRPLPKIVILTDRDWNQPALDHVRENTRLCLVKVCNGYEAQPTEASQVVKLLMTYNFKTQYHDNNGSPNTLYLKSDHGQGFKVESVCLDCARYNRLFPESMIVQCDPKTRLRC